MGDKINSGYRCILCVISMICMMTACGKKTEYEEVIQENVSQENSIENQYSNEASTQELSAGLDDVETEIETEALTEASTESEIEITTENPAISKRREPVKVKGIYVSGPVAGIEKMNDLIQLIDDTELNAMVIDIKNDEGVVTYKMNTPMVSELESSVGYIKDIDALIQKCKEKNIYLIARIVAFKDPYLAQQRPELAVKTKTGEVFKDKKGLAWVNPYKKEVWEYLLEIADAAVEDGFDEIQFDYIRFSTDLKEDKVDFGEDSVGISKTDIITQFTEYAYNNISELGAYVSADVYGTVIDSEVDQKIVGQDYVAMASHLDYICPMVYPSHYANGVYGIPIPDAQPYNTVKAAMESAHTELSVLPESERAINRVWIQAFTASWVDGYISYGPAEIREQIRGAYEAGYDEWILWNAAVNYKRDALLTDEEAQKELEAWDNGISEEGFE